MHALNEAQKQQVANLVRQRRLGLISMEDFTSFSEAVMGGTASQPEAVDELLLDSVITQEVIATPTSAAFNALHEFLVIGCVPDSPSVMCGNTRRKLPVQQHVCRAICYLFSS